LYHLLSQTTHPAYTAAAARNYAAAAAAAAQANSAVAGYPAVAG
jgi:hypothetical protein